MAKKAPVPVPPEIIMLRMIDVMGLIANKLESITNRLELLNFRTGRLEMQIKRLEKRRK